MVVGKCIFPVVLVAQFVSIVCYLLFLKLGFRVCQILIFICGRSHLKIACSPS